MICWLNWLKKILSNNLEMKFRLEVGLYFLVNILEDNMCLSAGIPKHVLNNLERLPVLGWN